MNPDATQNEDTELRLRTAQVRLLREERIRWLEASGRLDPGCGTCASVFYPHYREQWVPGGAGPFAPSHLASRGCESGKRPHCTCSACFG